MKYTPLFLRPLLLVLCFMPWQTFAQDDEEEEESRKYRHLEEWMKTQTFEGRLLCGLNCTQAEGDTYAGYHKAGLSAGGMVYVHFKPRIGASLEMLYTQKGVRGANVRESLAWGTYFDKYYLNLNYAEAALLLHLDMVLLDYEAGIAYSRLIGYKEWAEADVPIVFDTKVGYFNDYDVSYVAGLAYRFGKRWRINARYQRSAMGIRPPQRVYPRYSDGSEQLNELFSFRLMYTL